MLTAYIFWACVLVVFYTYLGYALTLMLITSLRRKPAPELPLPDELLPSVTVVVAAYNEEPFIDAKIRDALGLDYPFEKLSLIVVTDGSTDRTPEIVRTFPQVMLFHEAPRRGKIHAVSRVMPHVTSPVTVFCDANTFLNRDALRRIAEHYADPKVGGVAGEKRIAQKESDSAAGSGEGLYWRYESFLKKKDAELSSVAGAAGELFSIRTELFEAPSEDTIIEDFVLSMRIIAKGYRFAYEPRAYAIETASATIADEWKRKVRICAGAFQAMPRLTSLLNPFRYGWFSWQYFSHRVLRWTLAPLAMVVAFFCNIILAIEEIPLYQILLSLQFCFLFSALGGHLLRDKRIAIKGFFVPYYFVMMNAAVFAGFYRHLTGSQSVLWERAARTAQN